MRNQSVKAAAVCAVVSMPGMASDGLTDSQQRVLSAIQEHCEAIHALDQQGLLTGGSSRWAKSCWSLLSTYNAIVAAPRVTVDRNAVIGGIKTLQQLGKALEESSQFKPLSLGQGAIESASAQFGLLTARMEALRLGATGFSLAGLSGEGDRLYAAYNRPRGGAAGDVDEDDLLGGKLSVFLNGDFNFGDRVQTTRQSAFDFDGRAVTAGLDYRLTDTFVAGFAGRYMGSDLSIRNNGGRSSSDMFGISTYATYYLNDLHIDAIFSYQWTDYEMARNTRYGAGRNSVNARSGNTTSSRQYAISGGGGYDFNFNGFSLEPGVSVQYLHAETDAFTERGSTIADDMHINRQRLESLITTLGTRLNYTWNTSVGVLIPQIRAAWNHEFMNDQRLVAGYYEFDIFRTTFGILTDKPDRDYATFSAGMSGQFAHGISGFVNYATALGLRYATVHAVTAGFRMDF